jgi:RimJ/RimL family protein N-acetyltransferase
MAISHGKSASRIVFAPSAIALSWPVAKRVSEGGQGMDLTGKNIRLRALSQDDLVPIMSWVNDPEVTRGLLVGRYPMTDETERQWIESKMKASTRETLYTIETTAGEYVGEISLFKIEPVEHNAELGIVIGDKTKWGKGYATEAIELMLGFGFNQLNLNMIYLAVIGFNTKAISLYRRLGFVDEGCLRERVYRDGVYHDELSMSILRTEWTQRCVAKA